MALADVCGATHDSDKDRIPREACVLIGLQVMLGVDTPGSRTSLVHGCTQG